MSIRVAYRDDGIFEPLERVEGAEPGKLYTAFSEEELRDLRETLDWLKAAEKSFDFWNNPSDAVYDTKRGDIVLVPFPFTDLSSSKRRPALVVSPNAFNEQRQDLVLVAITSHLVVDSPLTIEAEDCLGGSLPKRSIVKPTLMC